MRICKAFYCKEEVEPGCIGYCGDCWMERKEHTEYERNWYGYWSLRGKNYIPEYTYPEFVGVVC